MTWKHDFLLWCGDWVMNSNLNKNHIIENDVWIIKKILNVWLMKSKCLNEIRKIIKGKKTKIFLSLFSLIIVAFSIMSWKSKKKMKKFVFFIEVEVPFGN